MDAQLAVNSADSPLRAIIALGAESSSHLYRGSSSPHPIGVVVRSLLEPPLCTAALLTLLLPTEETHDCRALLHWSSPLNKFEFLLGFRLVNTSHALASVLSRIAQDYPTRLYDEWSELRMQDPLAIEGSDCPTTLRSVSRTMAEDRTQPTSVRFTVVGDSAQVQFGKLRLPKGQRMLTGLESEQDTND